MTDAVLGLDTVRSFHVKYMLMVFEEAGPDRSKTPEQMAEFGGAHRAFADYLAERGIAVEDGHVLGDPSMARTLRLGIGEILVTPGPYGEFREALGGYCVIAARDLDAALDAARHCPMYAGIEVRPVWEVSR